MKCGHVIDAVFWEKGMECMRMFNDAFLEGGHEQGVEITGNSADSFGHTGGFEVWGEGVAEMVFDDYPLYMRPINGEWC